MEWAMCYSLGGVAEFSEFSWLAGFSFLSVLHCKNCCEVEITGFGEVVRKTRNCRNHSCYPTMCVNLPHVR